MSITVVLHSDLGNGFGQSELTRMFEPILVGYHPQPAPAPHAQYEKYVFTWCLLSADARFGLILGLISILQISFGFMASSQEK